MVEKIIVNPDSVRGWGNIVMEHTVDDYALVGSSILVDSDTVMGVESVVYTIEAEDSSISVVLSASVGSCSIGDSVVLSATVTDDSVAVEGGTVTFKLNTTTLGTDETDANGVATYTYTTTDVGSLNFTALYESHNSNTVSVVVSHDYSIAFSQSSYPATSGSATLEMTLLDNSSPVSGATVAVTGSDSSSYSCTTNSSGVGTVTVTGISAETTFTCTYSNVSDTCTVTAASYLFYDACDSASGLTNYGSSELVRGSNASITMSYDSTENAYLVSGSGNYHAFKPITALKDKDQYILSVDVKGQAIRYNLIGLYLDNYSNTTSYGLAFGLDIGEVDGSNQTLYGSLYRVSSDGSRYVTNLTGNPLVATKYYTLTFTVNGSTLTGALYDGTTKLAEKTVSYTISNKNIGIFLYCETGSTNSAGYIKNIKAEAL